MLRSLTKFLYIILVLLLIDKYIPGITISGFYTAVIVAIILGILNLFLKPILYVLTLPINIITLGFFSIIINATLFYFASSFVEGFYVADFLVAILGSLIISVADDIGKRLIY